MNVLSSGYFRCAHVCPVLADVGAETLRKQQIPAQVLDVKKGGRMQISENPDFCSHGALELCTRIPQPQRGGIR
jgi:hypothetical protein